MDIEEVVLFGVEQGLEVLGHLFEVLLHWEVYFIEVVTGEISHNARKTLILKLVYRP